MKLWMTGLLAATSLLPVAVLAQERGPEGAHQELDIGVADLFAGRRGSDRELCTNNENVEQLIKLQEAERDKR